MASKAFKRRTEIREVPLGKTRVLDNAQRQRDDAWVEHLLAEFDPDQIGLPITSLRDGHYYIIDGQHRIEALKRWLGAGWESQLVLCEVYSDLTEKDEAELFLRYNDKRTVRVADKFSVAVTAGRNEEVAIKRAVEQQGLRISKSRSHGITAVGSLRNVFRRSDAQTLGRALRLVRDSYGDAGFDAAVIDGMGYLCQRYNGTLDEEAAKAKLAAARGGVKGLLNRAVEIRLRTGNSKSVCVAAAAVDIINSGRGGNKLPSWWAE